MTREDAAIIVGNIPIDKGDDCYTIAEYQQAKAMAIKALEQETCEDCISRQAVLEKAINVPIAGIVTEDKVICRKIVFVDDIEKLPPVISQPKMGYWIDKDIRGSREPYCSVCGDSIDSNYHYNYCPNCGAMMQEVEE